MAFGDGSFGSGTFANSAAATTPTSINDAQTIGAITAAYTVAATPTSIDDADTLTGPTAAALGLQTPDTLTDTTTLGTVAVATTTTATPAGIANTDTLTAPAPAFNPVLGSTGDTETIGAPGLTQGPFYGEGLYGQGPYGGIIPRSIGDGETINDPALTTSPPQTGNVPDSIRDTDTLTAPSLPVTGTGYGSSNYGSGTYAGTAQNIPDPISDPETVGGVSTSTPATSGYGNGLYGNGLYVGTTQNIPASINDPETVGGVTGGTAASTGYGADPYGNGIYPGTAAVNYIPDPINDAETVLGLGGNAGTGYGSGPYGDGRYNGGDTAGVDPGAPAINTNFIYGAGTYSEGAYFGGDNATTTPEQGYEPAEPLFKPIPATYQGIPVHSLGIGPWSPQAIWRGAPNYGILPGYRAARPVVGLPAATSKSVTLRLNDGGEASADFTFNTADAVIPEPMQMDLWWRRKDPYTGLIEVIGRFNTASADISKSDDGLAVSAAFTDYRTLLGDRMVLTYNDTSHTDDPTNLWDKGTKVTKIMTFALPQDMYVDLSALTTVDLGTITLPFEIPLGSTVTEVFDNLLAISASSWEWWVEMPAATDAPPKLMLQPGTRGSDKGVTLADFGSGATPIATWTMNHSSDQYANTLYFTGADGGDVVNLPDQVALYGERDASDSDSSVAGTTDASGKPYLLDAAAYKRLYVLADRTPTWTLKLNQGFWRGRSHIDVGDTVGLVIRLGKELLSGSYRVTELTLDIDESGLETVTLTLGTPLSSAKPRSRNSPLARVVRRLKNYQRKDTS